VRDFVHGKILKNAANIEAALRRVQELAMRVVAGSADEPKEREEARTQILQELQAAGGEIPVDGPGEDGLSLEKSWHSLHYLLTGSAEPVDSLLGNTILGGKEIGPDLGYGPARFLDPNRVRAVAEALARMSTRDLARRFDLKTMKAVKIYACHDEGELELAQHYFEHLVQYYTDAASRGNAMLLYLD
jgi:hypothetical protein